MASYLILDFFIFAAVGIGFSVFLKPKGNFPQLLGLSGAIGFSFVSVLLTVFIEAGIRPSLFFWLALPFISMAFGTIFLFCAPRLKVTDSPAGDLAGLSEQAWLPLTVAFSGVLFAGAVTLFLGGPAFHILRGNGTDSFNYATQAAALDRLPLSVIRGTDAKTLIVQLPSLGLAKSLLTERWCTGALLGWCATISGSAPLQMTFVFGSLGLVLATGPCFLIARLVGLNPWQAAGLTVAILVGFWAQVVLDMQALSHLHALPIGLLVIFLVIKTQGQPWKDWITNGRLLTLSASCALALCYIEFIPYFLFGLSLHHGWMLFCRRVRLVQIIIDFLPVLSGVSLAFLISPHLFHFLMLQLRHGATHINTWHQAYYSWLYQNPLASFWGLTHIEAGWIGTAAAAASAWRTITGLLGLLLGFAALAYLVRTVRERGGDQARNLIAALIISGLIQVVVLLARQRWWAAGKAVSFLYPFLWLGAGWMAFTWPLKRGMEKQGKIVVRVIRAVAILWIASQLWLGIARIGLSAAGSDYKGYMANHGCYRRYDWNLEPIKRALGKPSDNPIALITENAWLGEYISLSLGNQWPIRFAVDIIDRAGNLLCVRPEAFRCRYLLVDRSLYPGGTGNHNHQPFPSTSDLVLLDIDRDATSMPILSAIRNPNGLERTDGGMPFFWMGGNATTIWVAASTETTVLFAGDWQAGPSFPEKNERTLEVLNEENGASTTQLIDPGTRGVILRLHRGVNRFTFRVLEKQMRSSLPNGDTRPLLLGLWNPHIEGLPRSP